MMITVFVTSISLLEEKSNILSPGHYLMGSEYQVLPKFVKSKAWVTRTEQIIFINPYIYRGYYTVAQEYEFHFRIVKYGFFPGQNKIYIFKPLRNFLFIIIIDKSSFAQTRV